MAFTDEEIAYLRSQPLARLATVSSYGQPDVVPVAFELDGTHFWIGGSGASVLQTRKFRNVLAGSGQVALVIDDMVSFDPFIARGIRSTERRNHQWSGLGWSVRASTRGSFQRCRGTGTWRAYRLAKPGTRHTGSNT